MIINNIPAITDIDIHMLLETQEAMHITFIPPHLVIDAHMHIQSNNCCPLTIQWALVAEALGWLTGRGQDDRETMGRTATNPFITFLASLGDRFGRIGLLRTDQIAQLFTSIVETMSQKETALFLFNTREEVQAQTAQSDAAAQEMERLRTPMADEYLNNFIKDSAFYFYNNKLLHFFIALPMDLSYAHYWGRQGLEINIPLDRGLSFINDYIAVELFNESNRPMVTDVTLNNRIHIPHDGTASYAQGEIYITKVSHHLYADFDLYEQYRRYREFAATGSADADKKFFLHFPGVKPDQEQLLQRPYKHFSEVLPGREMLTFENYMQQIALTVKSGVQSPFTLLPFYHYDPRRHYQSAERLTQLKEKITGQHAFFTLQEDTQNTVHFSDNTRYSGAVNVTPVTEMHDADFIDSLLNRVMVSNEKVYQKLLGHPQAAKNFFWGIKMYNRLGYGSDDFNSYPHLKDFYRNCMTHHIPITCHMSPGGMTFADKHNYMRFDANRMQDRYPIEESQHYINEHLASPSNWEAVLRSYGSLKLNLAHFAGYDLWQGVDDWIKSSAYNRYADWLEQISRMTDDYPNLYTDISYFNTPGHIFAIRLPDVFWWEMQSIANALADHLTRHPGLKDRLLMGSDWYMNETSGFQGMGNYFARMFRLLKKVSEKVHYDAWHQFAVINPLRFLGLIPEEKGSSGPFTLKLERLTKYRDCLLSYIEKDEWLKENDFMKTAAAKLKDQIARLYGVFENLPPIPDSSEIKDAAANLLILNLK